MGSMIKIPALEAFKAAEAYQFVGVSGVMSKSDVDEIYPDTDRQAYLFKWRTADSDHEAYLGLKNFIDAEISEDGTISVSDDNGQPLVLKLYSASRITPLSREVPFHTPTVRIFVDLETQCMLVGENFKVGHEFREFVKRYGAVSEIRFNIQKDFEIPDVSSAASRSEYLGKNFIPEASNRFAFSINRNFDRNTAAMEFSLSAEYQVEFMRLLMESFTAQFGSEEQIDEFNFVEAVNSFANMVDSIYGSYFDDIPF